MWRSNLDPINLARCTLCGIESPLISETLGLCENCIRSRFDRAQPRLEAVQAKSRQLFDLPVASPRAAAGVACPLCARGCVIGPGQRGYCGLRLNRDGRLVHLAGTPARGVLHWYRDPLPTNCVAAWVCAGQRRVGYHNLAVFYASCTINCLYCQNWHFRQVDPVTSAGLSARELADCADNRTFCVCYFGGDPASQMPHALASARDLARRGVTVCWETAGTAHPKLMDQAVQLSFETGGTVKFDLKAFDERLHLALTGAGNRQTLDNFARAAARFAERPERPLLVASTLLVPGYVTPDEVGRLAAFIANLNPNIPYALLGFAPNFYLPDLPCTSVGHAEAAVAAAHTAGLTNVRIGNRHLLSRAY